MKKIFIVEDDVDMATILQIALEGKYLLKIVHEYKNIPGALENFTPDILLIDYTIGLSNGAEVLKAIQVIEERNDIPFILFSAHPDIKNIAIEMNANAFLAKPFQLADLYICVDKAFADCPTHCIPNPPACYNRF